MSTDTEAARRVRVKICGVTRPEDAAVAEAAGADAIGLIFAEGSRRRVDVAAAAEIAAALGPFVRRVGVFVDPDQESVLEAIDGAGLDAVQLHGDAPAAWLVDLRRRVRVIRALRFRPGITPATVAGEPADAWLLDGLRPGSGEAFDWSQAGAWAGHARLIVAGGLRPGNVAAAVAALRPHAVDVASGVEDAPGRKDPALVRAFVAAVRRAESDAATASG